MRPTAGYSLIGFLAVKIHLGLAATEDHASTPALDNTDSSKQSPVFLEKIGQCPTTPKPFCDSDECQGITPAYMCTNTSPSQLNGQNVVLDGCPCCLEPIKIHCDYWDCRAPTGSRICQGDKLQGCACLTHEDLEEIYLRALEDSDLQPNEIIVVEPSFNPSDIADFGHDNDSAGQPPTSSGTAFTSATSGPILSTVLTSHELVNHLIYLMSFDVSLAKFLPA
ncbi:hypothetical protein M434DRAFT_393375 [Hypoxylon sp. CO27-5]|nr:hypothetical protein M434DRAFT_393375 [Hypoxylon sp. CO27-5]